MIPCLTCGAPLEHPTAMCAFDVPGERAPWRADYEAMARGEMSHAEHQVLVARWALHNGHLHSERALARLRSIAALSHGQPVRMFKLAGE